MRKNTIQKIHKAYKIGIYLFIFSSIVSGCKKDWLDSKPKKALVVPSTIRDYQALLEKTTSGFNDNKNFLTEHAAGDFYLTDAMWSAGTSIERNCYVWAPDIFGSDGNYSEWTIPYQSILSCNIALEGIEKIKPLNNSDQIEWNQVKGSALFFRAFKHFDIAQQFCKQYDRNSATQDLGIPLRLQSDFNVVSVRSTVQETYDQIVSDLVSASDLLPISSPINTIYKCRPNKAATYAMLARVYLSMSNYDSAYYYAGKSLSLYNNLMDFNNDPSINQNATGATFSITIFNKEVLFHSRSNSWTFLLANRAIVDSSLLNLYDLNDKRRDIFFRSFSSAQRFFGSYDGSSQHFGGLATDEVYLIRAECAARLGSIDSALYNLNALTIKRWKNNGSWVPFTSTDVNNILNKILLERRKELCFRTIRWTDLRRLNMEPQFAATLKRVVNGETHILPPNSPLYVFPIPDMVIQLTGMAQNPR